MPCVHDAHTLAHGTGARRRLRAAMAISTAVMLIEAVGGHLSHSLSLVADAGHIASDVVGLLAALLASQVGQRPANDGFTFGYRRWESLAAAFNGLTLVAVAVALAGGAVGRLRQTLPVDAHTMLGAGSLSLLGNLLNVIILRRHQPDDVNTRGAFLHVLADLMCAVGVIVSAMVMRLTGWFGIDACMSLAIALVVGATGVRLVARVLRVLAQAAPSRLATARVRQLLASLPQVEGVEAVRVWSVTPGHDVVTARLQVGGGLPPPELLATAHHQLHEQLAVAESTIELVPAAGPSLPAGAALEPPP